MYRMIAFDLDGTLLNSEKQISPANIAALNAAAAAGKTVALCSGRSLRECDRFIPLLPMVRYAVLNCGGTIWDLKEKKPVWYGVIPRPQIRAVLNAVNGAERYMQIHLPDTAAAEARVLDRLDRLGLADREPFYRMRTVAVNSAAEWADSHAEKLIKFDFIFSDGDVRDHALARLEGEPLHIVPSAGRCAEITAEGVSKGSTLGRLAALLGIPMEQVIMAGDSENDVSAIRMAGLGIAMGNALPCALEAADAVVSDCDHDGAAEAVSRYLLR